MNRRLLLLVLLLAVPTLVLGVPVNDQLDNSGQRTLTTHVKSKLLVDHKPYILPESRDLLFDQTSATQGAFAACQADSSFSFYPRICDNFTLAEDADIDSIVFWGGYWNPGYPGTPLGYNIEFYPDSGGGNGPCQNPIYFQEVMFTETQISGDWCVYEGAIPPFAATGGEIYWLVTQMVLTYPPQFGTNCSSPPDWGDGQEGYFKSAYFGYPQWVTATTVFGTPYENGFQLHGSTASADTFTWDFEDGWQDWTHTNGVPFPGGWGVIDSAYAVFSGAIGPPMSGDSCMALDSDAYGTGIGIDTAKSPVFDEFAEPYLHWAMNYENYAGYDTVTIIARAHNGSSWGAWQQLAKYDSDMGLFWDSADVSGITGDSLQVAWAWNDQGNWGWFCAFDNVGPVFLFPPTANDVATWSIDWPPASILINETGDPTATYRNVGGTQATFDVYFYIDSSGTNVYTGNVQSITLDPGAETTWVFTPQWTSGPYDGISYDVTSYCVFPGDENPANDTIMQTTTTTTVTDWIQCANRPTGEQCHATCYDPVDDYIYSLGGYHGDDTYYNWTYQYDPVGDSWASMATMPSAIDWIDASVAQWNRSIYVFGGYDGSFHNYNYIYDIVGDSWTTGTNMPATRIAGGQVIYNDSLVYFLCGHDGGGGTNTVYIYNTYTDSWTTGTNAPTTSFMMSVAMTGDTIWLVMTYNGSSCNPTMYTGIIDPANCENITWATAATLPVPNFNGGGTQNWRNGQGYIYEVGGFENSSTITNAAWEYDIAGDTWNALPPYPMTICRNDFLTYRRTGSAAEIYVTGGDNSGGWTETNETWKLAWTVTGAEEEPVKNVLVFGLSKPTPNPVSNGATIAYTTADEGPVSLKIYDASGRLVRTLVNRTEHAGTKTVRWNGKDSYGSPVAAGVYFYRLTAQNRTISEKMVVVR
jgi:N-acetylneuraminic acid mutarotase